MMDAETEARLSDLEMQNMSARCLITVEDLLLEAVHILRAMTAHYPPAEVKDQVREFVSRPAIVRMP